MSEDTSDETKNITNALKAVAPVMARLRDMVNNGDAYDLGTPETIVKAVEVYNAAKRTGKTINDVLNEINMFNTAGYSPAEVKMLQALEAYKRSGNKLSKFFNLLADININQGDPNQQILFAIDIPSMEQSIDVARSQVDDNGQTSLFDEREATKNEQSGESGGSANGRKGQQSTNAEGTEGTERERKGVHGELPGQSGSTGSRHTGNPEEANTGGAGPAGVRAGTELETAGSERIGAGEHQQNVSLTEAQRNPSPTETPGHDYEIKDDKTQTYVRFWQNIDAIKLLKELEKENRMPTPKEQEVLGNYNGWGGLKDAFVEKDGPDKSNKELRELLTKEEYESARASINDAFYTSPPLVKAILEGVSRLGFKGGRILDPSMGVGNFFGCMPRAMLSKSSLRGVETDNLTYRIAKLLYPSAFVENTGFQNAEIPNNFCDLVISNIPFDSVTIDGYKIHNYFFANGIDKVRPGGLMVFITS